jgi:hypothetical protein
MNLTELSFVLKKLYNSLGNNYLTKNFITVPFEFDVKVRYDRDDAIADYIIEVYSNPPMPKSFEYVPEVKEKKVTDGVHISVIKTEFKKLYEYVETDKSRKRFVSVKFMNQE